MEQPQAVGKVGIVGMVGMVGIAGIVSIVGIVGISLFTKGPAVTGFMGLIVITEAHDILRQITLFFFLSSLFLDKNHTISQKIYIYIFLFCFLRKILITASLNLLLRDETNYLLEAYYSYYCGPL